MSDDSAAHSAVFLSPQLLCHIGRWRNPMSWAPAIRMLFVMHNVCVVGENEKPFLMLRSLVSMKSPLLSRHYDLFHRELHAAVVIDSAEFGHSSFNPHSPNYARETAIAAAVPAAKFTLWIGFRFLLLKQNVVVAVDCTNAGVDARSVRNTWDILSISFENRRVLDVDRALLCLAGGEESRVKSVDVCVREIGSPGKCQVGSRFVTRLSFTWEAAICRGNKRSVQEERDELEKAAYYAIGLASECPNLTHFSLNDAPCDPFSSADDVTKKFQGHFHSITLLESQLKWLIEMCPNTSKITCHHVVLPPAPILAAFSALEMLDLDYSQVKEGSLIPLSKSDRLASLSLHRSLGLNQFSSLCFGNEPKNLWVSLTYLDLSSTFVGNVTVAPLADVISLTHLNLRSCPNLNDVKALRSAAVLKELLLSWTPIRNDSLEALAHLPLLRRLDLEGCSNITVFCPLMVSSSLAQLNVCSTKISADDFLLIVGSGGCRQARWGKIMAKRTRVREELEASGLLSTVLSSGNWIEI